MTTGQVMSRTPGILVPLRVVRRAAARAYCGPAHGQSWGVDVEGSSPAVVELDAAAGRVRYRLVLQPGSGLPARDYLGNYLYVPVQHDLDLG